MECRLAAEAEERCRKGRRARAKAQASPPQGLPARCARSSPPAPPEIGRARPALRALPPGRARTRLRSAATPFGAHRRRRRWGSRLLLEAARDGLPEERRDDAEQQADQATDERRVATASRSRLEGAGGRQDLALLDGLRERQLVLVGRE